MKQINKAEDAWKERMMNCIPATHKARFSRQGGRRLTIRPIKGQGEMTVEWIPGERSTVYITNLTVARKDRGCGLGNGLLAIAEKLCRTSRRTTLAVHARLSEKQRSWLERKGFVESETMYIEAEFEWTWYMDDTWQEHLSPEVLYSKYIGT